MRVPLHFEGNRRWPRLTLGIVIAAFLLLLPITTFAVPPISQGFATKDGLELGTLVSLITDSADTVEAANTDNTNNLLGIVISTQTSSIALGSGDVNEVQVATGGSVTALVSDINGEVKQGDQITASPIAGVGMKVSSNAKVIGIAQADMTITTEQKIESDGTNQTVKLGSVPLLINVSYHYQTPEKTLIPASIQNIANAVAGREANPLPIILSGIIFIVMLIVVMVIVFSMIRNSIISVGRNPLSQSAVYRDVIQLSAVIIIIIAASIAAIYFILRTM